MPFLTNCPSCSRQLRVPDELAGRNVKCPDCGTVFPAGTGGAPAAPAQAQPVEAPVMAPHERFAAARSRRGDSVTEARQALMGPAIVLLVISLLHLIGSGFALVNVLNNMNNRQAVAAELENQDKKRGQPRDQQEKEMRETIRNVTLEFVAGSAGAVTYVIGIVLGLIVLLGAISMLRVRSRGFALTACVLSVIPCLSPCCVLGIPFGIWGIVALNRPEVRDAFARAGYSDAPETHEWS